MASFSARLSEHGRQREDGVAELFAVDADGLALCRDGLLVGTFPLQREAEDVGHEGVGLEPKRLAVLVDRLVVKPLLLQSTREREVVEGVVGKLSNGRPQFADEVRPSPSLELRDQIHGHLDGASPAPIASANSSIARSPFPQLTSCSASTNRGVAESGARRTASWNWAIASSR